jgi:hypothetical protein
MSPQRGRYGNRAGASNLFQRYAWLEQEADDTLSLIVALAALIGLTGSTS